MTDNLPPELIADRNLVKTFLDTAKPGELPNAGVIAAQQRCQQWLDAQKPAPAQQPRQPQLNGYEKFKQMTARPDAPPAMPAWNRDQAFADSPEPQTAAARFMRLRMSPEIDQTKMPPWRDPRQS
jgi:hypothetical protein